MPSASPQDILRAIPQVDQLLQTEPFERLIEATSRQRVTADLRRELDAIRQWAKAGRVTRRGLTPDSLANRVAVRLEATARSYYRRVINATGVVLHTGLGRATLPSEAVHAVNRLAANPQRLEVDLATGDRGGRDQGCVRLLQQVLACEDATVVNNNAAATLVALAATTAGRKVVLSRGELVEIGGSYRVPEIIAQSGATLHEVGTTNRTHPRDYADAIDDDTGALLKVHTSNYQVMGFTSAVGIEALVEMGNEHGVPVIHDLGSGCLIELENYGLPADQLVQDSLAAGADLVCFSGDKLLGGPQAGILAGKAEAVAKCREHPLFRAVRPGRLVYTALEATLRLYLDGVEAAIERVPALGQLTRPAGEVGRRAQAFVSTLGEIDGLTVEVERCSSQAGSGALPLAEIESFGLKLTSDRLTPDQVAFALRTGDPAVLPRVRDGAVILDLRTVREADLSPLADQIRLLHA